MLNLTPYHQRRIAQTAIGASTIRGLGPRGTIGIIRTFLADLELAKLGAMNGHGFRSWLDLTTEELRAQLPSGAQHWGTARKCINIFARDALYNHDLRISYDLQKVESWLELPLDSHVAAALKREAGSAHLPQWETIKGLTPEAHEAYQTFANSVARKRGIARVHLDLMFWRAAPD